MSRFEQDIIDWKTALQTAITPVPAYQIWWTLIYKQRKRDRSFNPLKINFFGRSYLRC